MVRELFEQTAYIRDVDDDRGQKKKTGVYRGVPKKTRLSNNRGECDETRRQRIESLAKYRSRHRKPLLDRRVSNGGGRWFSRRRVRRRDSTARANISLCVVRYTVRIPCVLNSNGGNRSNRKRTVARRGCRQPFVAPAKRRGDGNDVSPVRQRSRSGSRRYARECRKTTRITTEQHVTRKHHVQRPLVRAR